MRPLRTTSVRTKEQLAHLDLSRIVDLMANICPAASASHECLQSGTISVQEVVRRDFEHDNIILGCEMAHCIAQPRESDTAYCFRRPAMEPFGARCGHAENEL